MRRRFLVPEVVQISSTDCGPAALKSVLEGYGIHVSYGRLREACQTDVDGTSIDTLEELANQVGLEATQTMLPADHLLLPEAEALPAIVVVRLPNGLTHFLVVWSRLGGMVQVMDPMTGRRWATREQLLREAYIHSALVSAEEWREWAGSSSFLQPLERRLLRIGLADSAKKRIEEALADPTWRSLGELDAVARMVESILQAGGLERGGPAARVFEAFLEQLKEDPLDSPSPDWVVPGAFWSVLKQREQTGEAADEVLLLRGAVVLTVSGRPEASAAAVPSAAESPTPALQETADGGERPSGTGSLEIAAALAEPPPRPWRELLRFLRAEGMLTPVMLLGASALASVTVLLEALLFRSLLGIGRSLGVPEQRVPAGALLLAFLLLLLLLDFAVVTDLQRLGRKLETRLRIAFLEKLPRLNDRYIQSRPTSDMADRCHSIHRLRLLPPLAGQFLRDIFELAFTAAGIVWLNPASAPQALALAVVAVALPLATQPILAERDLRVRSHASALSRFYLDALLGLTPIRTHGAERAVRREHEGLLVEWIRAGRLLLRGALAVEGITVLVSFALTSWLFIAYLRHTGETSGALLLLYWALNLPVLGQGIAVAIRQYPSHRNVSLRLIEPLGALEDRPAGAPPPETPLREAARPSSDDLRGVAIRMDTVNVVAAGHTILEDVDLTVSSGEHVAVVGASGAGKSTLLGLLLGWHRPARGTVLVDDLPLEASRLDSLRSNTAWVDPAVQLWNRSLLENLIYGEPDAQGVGRIVQPADLRRVLESLPNGLQTVLGEGGALVSGGEGQRVRLGRAMIRRNPRLVLLDEPFRSLDREQRRALLAHARTQWKGVTLLCVTHDIGETVGFERVLVVDGGRIVEDDAPAKLAARPDSLYRALLDAEAAVQKTLWSSTTWRRLRVEQGRILEAAET